VTRPHVCIPLRSEYLALRGRIPSATVTRTGMGPVRSTAHARRLSIAPAPVLVTGVAGSLQPAIRTGDVVVASEVRRRGGGIVTCFPHRDLVEGLRAAGLTVHVGPIVTTPRLRGGSSQAALADTGALAVDMESFDLVCAGVAGESAVVRVIVDTIDAPLLRAGTIVRGMSALRALRAAAPAIEAWAASYDAGRRAAHPADRQPANKEVT
jgi:4-hydroxy-3-methylbut-2-en-1-yl diphosphate reductase